jgi:hypothetical protein
MFIWGNKTGSVKYRSRSLTCSTFPLRSPTTSTRGSQGSSGTASLDMVLRLLVALDIVGFELSHFYDELRIKDRDYGFLNCTGLLSLQNSEIAKFFENDAFSDEFSGPYIWLSGQV